MEETLGKRIIANRKRIGLTQDKLAEQLGVTAQAVSKWENDQSCPDITTLPKLAQMFGISTDELLGMDKSEPKPVLEAEVIENDGDGHRIDVGTASGGKWEMHWDAGRKSGVGFALWVLLTGALLLTSNILQWNATFWDILWPTALLVFGVFGLAPKFSFFRLGCGLFGGYFLLTNLGLAEKLPGKEILLPALLVLLGLSLLADALKAGKKPRFTVTHNGKEVYADGKKKASDYSLSEDGFSCSTSFGEDHHRVELPRLAGGSAQVSFGELSVDLTGCGEIADGCRIDASCAFGELELRFPKTCRVEHTSHTAFAQVDVSGHHDADAKTTVYVNCEAHFGEISIRYV